jgi:hypothetical protein
MKDEKERREQNFSDFDGDWIYNEAKKIDMMPNIQGTFFRAGLKVLKNTGAKVIGSNDDYSKYRIGGYVQVDSNIDAIKQAIYEYGIVLGGFVGSNNGWSSAIIRPPIKGEAQWGHAVCLTGFFRISKDDNILVKQGKMTMNEARERWYKGISRYSPM